MWDEFKAEIRHDLTAIARKMREKGFSEADMSRLWCYAQQNSISKESGPDWPDRIEGRIWMPDDDFSEHPLARQRYPPQGIVVHSGSLGAGVAEYAAKEPDGRKVSYHFAWSSQRNQFVQMVSLRKRAWHAGKEGNDWIGICLPGPWDENPRSQWQKDDFRYLVTQIQGALGWQLKYWCRHSDISSNRRDPGPGFSESWVDGLGLEHRPGGPLSV
jgi:hypothetical protein